MQEQCEQVEKSLQIGSFRQAYSLTKVLRKGFRTSAERHT